MSSDDRVGPGRPPRHSQFRPGQSGNPGGRPRGSMNLQTIIDRELRKVITITENGRSRRLTKHEALVMTLVHLGLKGNHRATELLFRIMAEARANNADKASDEEAVAPDRDTLRRIKQRLDRIVSQEKRS